MTRRIKKHHLDLFDKYKLTDREQSFILGCIKFQEKYPQLSNKQWRIVVLIYERYRKKDESKPSQETP